MVLYFFVSFIYNETWLWLKKVKKSILGHFSTPTFLDHFPRYTNSCVRHLHAKFGVDSFEPELIACRVESVREFLGNFNKKGFCDVIDERHNFLDT